jgi:hypothetical protein
MPGLSPQQRAAADIRDALSHVESLLEDKEVAQGKVRSAHSDPHVEASVLVQQTIWKLAPTNSMYLASLDEAIRLDRQTVDETKIQRERLYDLLPVLRVMEFDFAREGFWKLESQIRFNVLAGELDLARELAREGGPLMQLGAVAARIVLEAHLRKLAPQFDVKLISPKNKYFPASRINAELKAKQAYGTPEWRQVDSWLDRGNVGAHPPGQAESLTEESVLQMIEGVELFLKEHPT